jgi:hypothetical protein
VQGLPQVCLRNGGRTIAEKQAVADHEWLVCYCISKRVLGVRHILFLSENGAMCQFGLADSPKLWSRIHRSASTGVRRSQCSTRHDLIAPESCSGHIHHLFMDQHACLFLCLDMNRPLAGKRDIMQKEGALAPRILDETDLHKRSVEQLRRMISIFPCSPGGHNQRQTVVIRGHPLTASRTRSGDQAHKSSAVQFRRPIAFMVPSMF